MPRCKTVKSVSMTCFFIGHASVIRWWNIATFSTQNDYCIQNIHSIIKWFTHYVGKDNMKKHSCVWTQYYGMHTYVYTWHTWNVYTQHVQIIQSLHTYTLSYICMYMHTRMYTHTHAHTHHTHTHTTHTPPPPLFTMSTGDIGRDLFGTPGRQS